jgi:hypothetical protein
VVFITLTECVYCAVRTGSLYGIFNGNSAILQEKADVTKILISDAEWLPEDRHFIAGTVPVQRDVLPVNCTRISMSQKPIQTKLYKIIVN